MTITNIKTYSELVQLHTFKERYHYLKLGGFVGKETFGFDRFINQRFYRSGEWKKIRNHVIVRDNGCDLGIDGHEIYGKIIIHHMNPVTLDDVIKNSEFLMNPEYLISVSHVTHNAIHYGDENFIISPPAERTKNDTCPWKSKKGGYGMEKVNEREMRDDDCLEILVSGNSFCADAEMEEEPKYVMGIVTDCTRLSIRKRPESDSEILCKAEALSEVMIDYSKSNNKWFCVCTSAGIEGFCLRRFIAIKESFNAEER